ncbi:MAG TPA: hypothetical protein VF757_09165 [Sphingomicrobium sp.]
MKHFKAAVAVLGIALCVASCTDPGPRKNKIAAIGSAVQLAGDIGR